MIARILFFSLLIGWVITGSAQESCRKTVVHFEFGKYNLTKEAQQTLDDLVGSIREDSTYLVELSGHTDSVNTAEFNMKLSKNRNNAVRKYLERKSKSKLNVKEFPHGELMPVVPNTSEENMAKNRRVEIYLVNRVGDKLIFTGEGNETIEIPAEFAGGCSICETLNMNFAHNDQEASSANLSLKSGEGRALTTAGLFQFGFDCPEADQCLPVKVTLPVEPGTRLECFTTWQQSNRSWKQNGFSMTVDRQNNTITLTDSCYKLGSWAGILKPLNDLCTHQLNFSDELSVTKTKVYTKDSTFFVEPEDMPLVLSCGSNDRMFSWAMVDGQNYYFNDDWSGYVDNAENTGHCDTMFTYDLGKDDYTAVPVSDTTVFAKLKGFDDISEFGFYIEELDLVVPIENVKGSKYEANYLNYDHTLRIVENKTYDINYSDVKTKYKKGKKKLKLKIKKKKLSND